MPAEPPLEWTHPEGTHRVIIEPTSGGRFRLIEERFVTCDEIADGGGIYDYWMPAAVSGLCPSVLDAQNDAGIRHDWLATLLDEIASRSSPVRP